MKSVDDGRTEHGYTISSPCELDGSGELKMVDDDDGRTPDHGHPISSPCEPYGSGELKTHCHIINTPDATCQASLKSVYRFKRKLLKGFIIMAMAAILVM